MKIITNWYGDLYFANANSVGEGAKDVLVFFYSLHSDRARKVVDTGWWDDQPLVLCFR
jgi:hypothetical protein